MCVFHRDVCVSYRRLDKMRAQMEREAKEAEEQERRRKEAVRYAALLLLLLLPLLLQYLEAEELRKLELLKRVEDLHKRFVPSLARCICLELLRPVWTHLCFSSLFSQFSFHLVAFTNFPPVWTSSGTSGRRLSAPSCRS